MSREAQKRSSLSPEESHRLTAFFELLIRVDQRECITKTAQRKNKERAPHEA